MRVKKFTAPTIPEALDAIKREFGDDAMIMHERICHKPILGLFGRSYVEVTAGIDERPAPSGLNIGSPSGSNIGSPSGSNIGSPSGLAPGFLNALENHHPADSAADTALDTAKFGSLPTGDVSKLQKMAQEILKKRQTPPHPEADKLSGSPPPLQNAAVDTFLKASDATEESFAPLKAPLAYAPAPPQKKTVPPILSTPAPANGADDDRLARVEEQVSGLCDSFKTFIEEQKTGGEDAAQRWIDYLTERGIDPGAARNLAESIPPEERTEERIREAVLASFSTTGPIEIPPETDRPKVVMLVGPTGVGKTTTLAKLAATYALALEPGIETLRVVLVTADLYRMGAVVQLKEYAKILKTPIEEIYGADEVRDCIARNRDADLLLIDTVGSSQRNEDQLGDLLKLAKSAQPCEIHLVVSATIKDRDMADMVEHFGIVNPDALIITKVDETTTLGSLYPVLDKARIPISYITTGQIVPEDIEVATPEGLAEMIFDEGAGPIANDGTDYTTDTAERIEIDEPQERASDETPSPAETSTALPRTVPVSPPTTPGGDSVLTDEGAEKDFSPGISTLYQPPRAQDAESVPRFASDQ